MNSSDVKGYRTLYLDIDGVLNSHDWFERAKPTDRRLGHLDPDAVARVQRICDATDARITISSTWRLLHSMSDIRGWLYEKGLRARVSSRTPDRVDLGSRGEEIEEHLKIAYLFPVQPLGIVILDDDSDMGRLLPWLVKTTFRSGLTDEDVEKAIRKLREPMPSWLRR